MSDSTVVPLRQPDEVDDPLTAILRSGARRLLAQAVEAEAEAFPADGLQAGHGRRETWRRLKGENQLPKVIQGVTFRDGVEVADTPQQTAG